MGRVIFELEVGTEVYEIESFHTGFLKISGTPGDSYKIGDCIGTMVCEQMPEGLAVFGIELASSDVSKLDRLRGGRSRREYLMDLVRTALNAQASE